MKQTESASATPEQLLKMIESQLQVERSKRSQKTQHRTALLVGGILFIVLLAGGALLVLQNLLLDLQTREPHSTQPPSVTETHGNL